MMRYLLLAALLLIVPAAEAKKLKSEECLPATFEAGLVCRQADPITPVVNINGWRIYLMGKDYYLTYYNGKLVKGFTSKKGSSRKRQYIT